MNAGAVRVAWYRLRAGPRRPWSGLVSLVLLIALVGGLAMASVAGARRTESSFPVFDASTNPSTVGVFSRYLDPQLGSSTGYNASLQREIARVPLVAREAAAIIFDANIDIPSIKGAHFVLRGGESPPAFLGSLDGEFSTIDRVTLVRGRLADPSRRDEAVMSVQAAQQMGLHVGSVIRVPFYTDADVLSSGTSNPALVARVKLVGEVEPAQSVIESDLDSLKAALVIFSPALTKVLARHCATGTETFLQIKGGATNAKGVLNAIDKFDRVAAQFPAQVTAKFIPVIQSTITPEAIAMGVFGGIAGL